MSQTKSQNFDIERLEVVKLTEQYIKSSRIVPLATIIYDGKIIISRIYETQALLPELSPADWDVEFLNVAITFDSILSPKDMLLIFKTVEREMGRKSSAKWAPRVIDLDIIFAGQEVINESHEISNFLIIPHKEFMNRTFFIVPVADIAPDYVHPLFGITISNILIKQLQSS
ncbi:2-amino-4-hydroxy-6-hydroxymethyldihydropteridine diphosphokinase [Candidatus Lariskella endosymbiont of Hedychridium roseum]|uniref:2-amino-4-hydroxy-6- hydroxymethyldihydropteridine diphosphokinase n=1 Tax=Candidatus Lariskella endosymbiont of Hedychridium roseum TaxID=3077949 RepID=UPI0030CBDDD4